MNRLLTYTSALVELMRPNKTDVLSYLDNDGPAPTRYAHVVLDMDLLWYTYSGNGTESKRNQAVSDWKVYRHQQNPFRGVIALPPSRHFDQVWLGY